MSATPSPALSPAELARYSRHILLENVGVAGQQKLAAARVLIIGAGGLGSPAALYLAAAGIGTLGLADFDHVEEHNLQRQLLHDTAAVGTPKVDSAAARLAAINPYVRVILHRDGITPANAREIFSAYDVIIDGTDNFRALSQQRRRLLRAPPARLRQRIQIRRTGLRLCAPFRRSLLPLPFSRAPRRRHRPELRRSRRHRGPLRRDWQPPSPRSDQAHPRSRRFAPRPPAHLRRPRAALHHARAPAQPRLPALRRTPDHPPTHS